MQRIDLRLFHQRNRGRKILRILVEGAEEDEQIVRAAAIDIVPVRNIAAVTWRQNEELSPFAGVRTWQANVAEELATVHRDRPLPEVEQNALEIGWRLEHDRAGL